jgi:hypothetical protein
LEPAPASASIGEANAALFSTVPLSGAFGPQSRDLCDLLKGGAMTARRSRGPDRRLKMAHNASAR